MATAADLAAARRLIAQFEERALGRSNSGQQRPNLARATGSERSDWRECAIGEVCRGEGWWGQGGSVAVRVVAPTSPLPSIWRWTDPNRVLASLADYSYWEFHLVSLKDARQRRVKLWKRVL